MNSSSYRRWVVALTVALSPCVAFDASAAPPYEDELTPGELRGVAMTFGDPWRLGYWEYLPASYDDLGPGELLPLLVFLPGIGEYDDVSSCPGGTDVCSADACGGDGLCRNLSWGPQQHMRAGNWDDTTRPFIMVSPQNDVAPFTTNEWEVGELETFFAYIVENYPVDPRRMYITGMSQGGRGVLQYLDQNPRQFAAAAPMPAGTVFPTDVGCNLQDTALWMFHGEDDNNANLGAGVFSPCSMVGVEHMYNHPDAYPGSPSCVARVSEPGHPAGRMTMFYDVGHFAWVEAINPVGEGFPASEWASDQGCGIAADFRDYSAASDPDGIYSWFASLDRPDVAVPDDFEVSGDDGSTTITATITDDDTITWTWTQTAGPAATLVDADTETLQVDDLAPMTQYTFEVLALDADGQWDRDEITVDVSAATVGGSSSSDGGITTDPGSTGVVITDTVSGSETDATTGDVSASDTDATTGVVTSVTDTDATTGVITSDTDATTGVITSVTDTDATTGVVTSVTDTDATTGVITSDTDATTGV
ncbi:MAG: hypothetical protein IAG13_21430, partial [Deltaproteobacteria bacterium]|nr:hypothetical protein [Nannocystaceae bacterium]